MKNLFSIILAIVGVVVFFAWTLPQYQSLGTLQTEAESLESILANSRRVEEVRGELNEKYRQIAPDDLEKLDKIVPEGINNVQLILELQKIAERNRLTLLNINSSEEEVITGNLDLIDTQEFQTEQLDFELIGSYENFVNFLRDIESNIRITDVLSIDFGIGSVDDEALAQTDLVYNFNVEVATYWRP